MISHRSAPGGSGAGGSVFIITKTLHGNPQGRISVQGGAPIKCAFGAGGGKSTVTFLMHFTHLNSSVNDDVRVTQTRTWTVMMLTTIMMITMTMTPTTVMLTTITTTKFKITTTKTTSTDNGCDSTLSTASVPIRHFFSLATKKRRVNLPM